MEILLHTTELGDGATVANASVDDFAELIAQTSHLGLVHYLVYDERDVRLVASSDPGIAAKIAQSDVPDNLLSLLSALRAAGTCAS
ncbi:hypothetical protein ASE35_03565 [Lysobacter sp. Root916]|uniref:hypothetical protein n=1 Tax=Lysobacter sp. Root916 TaxID=1736606 RepID=UPI000708C579|nr:hypothetical protein [Lysobacter sp. Root916]KRD39446.1 hypothetical protein ASE35_03565 [Lysobacter sp. Root916]